MCPDLHETRKDMERKREMKTAAGTYISLATCRTYSNPRNWYEKENKQNDTLSRLSYYGISTIVSAMVLHRHTHQSYRNLCLGQIWISCLFLSPSLLLAPFLFIVRNGNSVNSFVWFRYWRTTHISVRSSYHRNQKQKNSEREKMKQEKQLYKWAMKFPFEEALTSFGTRNIFRSCFHVDRRNSRHIFSKVTKGYHEGAFEP